MKLKITFLILLFSSYSLSVGQSSIEWQKVFGGSQNDRGHSIYQTKDGGFVVCGNSNSKDGDLEVNNGNSDILILKLDNHGNLEWKQSIGGYGYDEAFSIKQTNDLGFVVVGYTKSYEGNIYTKNGEEDLCIIKLDSKGLIKWIKIYGGSKRDVGGDIIQTSDDGYLVSAGTNSVDGDIKFKTNKSYDLWILKLTANGDI